MPAAVVYSEDKSVEEGELRDFLARHIAAFKLPARIWIADAPLPKLGTGKIDKVSLRRRYGGAEVAGPA